MIGRIVLCCVWLLWPALVSAACVVQPRATVKLQIVDMIVLAPVEVNGIPGTFILDTGAIMTVVTPDAVSHFNLALDEWTSTTLRGVGGVERRRNADPRSVELGGVALHRRSLARDATLRVMTLPLKTVGGRQIDGLLGRDFLSLFDLDLDFPGRTLTLFDVHDCAGRFLPWSEPYLSVAVENPAESAMVVPLAVDDVPLRALLDTGASRSLIERSGMARLQLGLDRLQGDPTAIGSGMGPHTVTMWQHTFRDLRIGTESFNNPVFLVTADQLQPGIDMLLGADWLVGRRVWISYATRQLFATK
jgi:predicted aspartyl protease